MLTGLPNGDMWLSQSVCVMCNILCKYTVNNEGNISRAECNSGTTHTSHVWTYYYY